MLITGGVITVGGSGFVLGASAGDLENAFLLGIAGAVAVVVVSTFVGGVKWLFNMDRKMTALTNALEEGFGSGANERHELSTELAERHDAVLEIASAAAAAAQTANELVETRTTELSATIETGFAEAKQERELMGARLDRSIEAHETFTTAAIAVTLGAIERLDALDGKNTVDDLRALIDRGGELLPPTDPDTT